MNKEQRDEYKRRRDKECREDQQQFTSLIMCLGSALGGSMMNQNNVNMTMGNMNQQATNVENVYPPITTLANMNHLPTNFVNVNPPVSNEETEHNREINKSTLCDKKVNEDVTKILLEIPDIFIIHVFIQIYCLFITIKVKEILCLHFDLNEACMCLAVD